MQCHIYLHCDFVLVMQAEVWVTGELHVRAAKHNCYCTPVSCCQNIVLVGQAEMVRVASVIITTQSMMVVDCLVCQMCVHADCIL